MTIFQVNKFIDGTIPITEIIVAKPLGGLFWSGIATFNFNKLITLAK